MRKHNLYLLFTLLIFSFTACSDKDKNEPEPEYNEVNEWIYNKMQTEYLWNHEIPTKTTFDGDTEAFFKSLLYRAEDGRVINGNYYPYSSINKKKGTTKSYQGDHLSLGFEYIYYNVTINQLNITKKALQIIYIIPDSPADKAGLKRGTWVQTINNQKVDDDVIDLMFTGKEVILGISDKIEVDPTETVNITAESVYDSPVYIHKVLSYENQRIAYLMYNHFTSGVDDETTNGVFDQELKAAFQEFKNNTFDEFILDLRYNNGGLVTCARLLASLLAPASANDDIFCKLVYNQDRNREYTYKFDFSMGDNLDLSKLYIITSTSTASASEAVINGLKPFLGNNLILVGDQTEGKNVGAVVYSEDKFDWEIHPIVCYVRNKNGDNDDYQDYANGFKPDFECVQDPFEEWSELGSIDEYVLNKVLNYITKGTPIESKLRSSSATNNKILLANSLDRKKSNAILLSNEF